MIGKYPAKLDEKNRLFVPAKLRAELGDDFYVTLGVNCGHSCLTVYTAEDWQKLSENYNNLPISQRSAATSLVARMFTGWSRLISAVISVQVLPAQLTEPRVA